MYVCMYRGCPLWSCPCMYVRMVVYWEADWLRIYQPVENRQLIKQLIWGLDWAIISPNNICQIKWCPSLSVSLRFVYCFCTWLHEYFSLIPKALVVHDCMSCEVDFQNEDTNRCQRISDIVPCKATTLGIVGTSSATLKLTLDAKRKVIWCKLYSSTPSDVKTC